MLLEFTMNRIIIRSFLTAIGAELSEVKRFPPIFPEEAGFLPVEHTSCNIQIGKRQCSLKKIPLNVDGTKCYRTVYSFRPQLFFFNEERKCSVTNNSTYSMRISKVL
jgi:hypothetical protein